MIKAVGFDLGDTLIEYEGVPLNWSLFYNDALKVGFDKISIEYSSDIFQICESVLLRYNTRANQREVEYSAEKIFGEFGTKICINEFERQSLIDSFFGFFQQKSVLFNDTVHVLNQLKAKNLKIGVLTDVAYGMPIKFVREDVHKFNDKIDSLVTSVDVGFRKPNPIGYTYLANKLNVSIDEILYVGNEEKDIIGAKIAGYKYAILINRGGNNKCFGQDFEFPTLAQMLSDDLWNSEINS